MLKLSQVAFKEVQAWIHLNARPIDLAIWKFHFEDGDVDLVLNELTFYQNEDGGFGKKLDPDNWNNASSPYNTQLAIKLMRQIGFVDINHPIYKGIFNYLENTEYQRDYGWIFTIPSNNNFPHAVWWDYSESENIYQSTGTTASLSGFILRFCKMDSTLYNKAYNYAQFAINKLKMDSKLGDMGVGGYCELLVDLEETDQKKSFDIDFLRKTVHSMVRNKILIEKDNFMANPLEFILSPESKYYPANQEEVEFALDQLIELRTSQGVWDIPWEWYNGNKYPKEFAISENWWKGIKAIEKLLQLKSFGRFE